MANLVFYMDYGPLLSRVHKSAFMLYMYYDKLQTEKGVVQITYSDLNDHLGLASSTVTKSNALLKKLELIEEIESPSGKRYRMLPVKKLSSELKETILRAMKVESYISDTGLRKHYLENDIPPEYQQILNKKALKQAHKEIGSLRKIRNLCEYFKVDYYTFKLLFERDGDESFKTHFKKIVGEIEVELAPKSPKKKVGIGSKEKELASYLYDKLKELGATPIARNWYVRNCRLAQNVLGSVTIEEAKGAVDWGFEDSWWKDKITDLNCMDKLYSRYRLTSRKDSQSSSLSRLTPIPADIQVQIAAIVSMPVETYEDAAFLKQSILDGQENEDISKVVSILEKSGIIPTGNENLNFG